MDVYACHLQISKFPSSIIDKQNHPLRKRQKLKQETLSSSRSIFKSSKQTILFFLINKYIIVLQRGAKIATHRITV